jgi:hypothetical protein
MVNSPRTTELEKQHLSASKKAEAAISVSHEIQEKVQQSRRLDRIESSAAEHGAIPVPLDLVDLIQGFRTALDKIDELKEEIADLKETLKEYHHDE